MWHRQNWTCSAFSPQNFREHIHRVCVCLLFHAHSSRRWRRAAPTDKSAFTVFKTALPSQSRAKRQRNRTKSFSAVVRCSRRVSSACLQSNSEHVPARILRPNLFLSCGAHTIHTRIHLAPIFVLRNNMSGSSELTSVLMRRQEINDALDNGEEVTVKYRIVNVYTEFCEFTRKEIKQYESTFKKWV